MTRERTTQIALLLLRIFAGVMFLEHGGMKLFGWLGGMPGGGTAPVTSEMGIAGVLELAGGALIVIGLFTRPVAFILAGEMAVAYFQAHAPHGWFSPVQNHGELAVLYCFIFLYLAARGAGEYSLDAVLQHRRPTAAPTPATPATQN